MNERPNFLITPKIYVGTYAKFHNGNLTGAWFDMRDFETADDFYSEAKALHSDEADPELMLLDFDGIPWRIFALGSIDEKFFEWLKLEDHERELVEIYFDNIGGDDFDKIIESFAVTFDREAEWAEEFLNDTAEIPDHLVSYIDYEKYARDADVNFVRHNGTFYAFYNF